VTVPAIIATLSGRVVTNDYPQITLDLSTERVEHHRAGAADLYPVAQRPEIDALTLEVYTDLNNGVHRAGFASSQEVYQTGNDGCSGAWTHSRMGDRSPIRSDYRQDSCPCGLLSWALAPQGGS